MHEYFYLPDVEYPADEEGMLPSYEAALKMYQSLRKFGVNAQDARYVLPNAMRTRLIMSANLREWRHIVSLRLHPRAQPEMQELMKQVYDQLVMVFPRLMDGVLDNQKEVR
jgi:thymidylate synthase (FAD)